MDEQNPQNLPTLPLAHPKAIFIIQSPTKPKKSYSPTPHYVFKNRKLVYCARKMKTLLFFWRHVTQF